MESQTIREALLWKPMAGDVRCLTCERRCEMADGETGWCRTRENRAGTLVTLIYGAVSSLSCNPIEKKPLYHFYPGTLALTAGSWSCNFNCPWCQNWRISKSPPAGGEFIAPDEFVGRVRDLGCQGTSISLNEPALSLEWSLEVFRLARAAGFYNTLVTNGYLTEGALNLLLAAGLDGVNVDIKGDAAAVRRYCGGIDIEHIWRNCRLARDAGAWLEITTLVIPGVNDRDPVLAGIAARMVAELGRDVPWHVTRYHPAFRFAAPPTPVGTMERAWELGKAAGLDWVYVGNLPGHRGAHSYCPGCGAMLIERSGTERVACHLRDGRCFSCGRPVPGVWASGLVGTLPGT